MAEGVKMLIFRGSLLREWTISHRLPRSISGGKKPYHVGCIGLCVICMVCGSWHLINSFHIGITLRFCIVVCGFPVDVEPLDSGGLSLVNIGIPEVRMLRFWVLYCSACGFACYIFFFGFWGNLCDVRLPMDKGRKYLLSMFRMLILDMIWIGSAWSVNVVPPMTGCFVGVHGSLR